MFEATVRGWIGGTTPNTEFMKPTKEEQVRRDGAKGHFMRFKMFVPDLTKAKVKDQNGNERRENMIVQVILPDSQKGLNWFRDLHAGRYITVRGNFYLDVNEGKDKSTGEKRTYTNMIVRPSRIEFNDQPPVKAAARLFKTLKDECGVLSQEDADKYMAAFEQHIAGLRIENPTQRELDTEGRDLSQGTEKAKEEDLNKMSTKSIQ